MQKIKEMIVFVEPDCLACKRAMETAEVLRRCNIVAELVIHERTSNPEACAKFGVVIFPAVVIDGKLAFYGEFSVEDARRFIN